MTKGIHFHTRMLQLAAVWRTGAEETRDRYRDANGKVPFTVEVSASALETCAERVENEVREHMQATREIKE